MLREGNYQHKLSQVIGKEIYGQESKHSLIDLQ